MKRTERRQQEQEIEAMLRTILGDSFKEVDFCYYRKNRGMLVTYEDFKPEKDLLEEIRQAVGSEWNVVLKREYSDLAIMMAMLKMFKKNRVAIVDIEEGELRPYQIREYVLRQMEGQ